MSSENIADRRARLLEDPIGSTVGIDPHKKTLTAAVVDYRGGLVAVEHFRVSGDGHRQLEAWALSFGRVARWGVEGVSGWGRHTGVFLAGRGHDVRDVCPNRTNRRDHGARRSLLKSRQHLVNEAESLLAELPLELRDRLPDTRAVRPRLTALATRILDDDVDAPTALRVRMLAGHQEQIAVLDAREREIVDELKTLVAGSGSTLDELCGLATRMVAELLVEVGDPRRFTEAGFARFNASAPIPASTAEGPGEPVRHRYNPGGNRRVNAILHRIAVTQLRCEPRARALYDNARANGHTKREARRILKRHLSNVIYRRMIRDLKAQTAGAAA